MAENITVEQIQELFQQTQALQAQLINAEQERVSLRTQLESQRIQNQQLLEQQNQ